jgi:3-isopropylmalate/(R)-2-methylmalate dehydratase small subunit
LLPVVVPEKFLNNLLDLIQRKPESLAKIDLEKQLITVIPTEESFRFEINPYKKECLLKGLDDIDYLLSLKDLITSFETGKKS